MLINGISNKPEIFTKISHSISKHSYQVLSTILCAAYQIPHAAYCIPNSLQISTCNLINKNDELIT